MEALQDFTDDQKTTSVDESISPSQKLYIDFKAIGGWITDPDSPIPTKMSLEAFAKQIGVSRQSLYDWQKLIPDFWGRVAQRRREIGSQERLIKVHDSWYLKALSGSFPHMQLWLANFDPNFRMPTEKMQVEAVNSWAALAAKKREESRMIEAEVIPNATTNQ